MRWLIGLLRRGRLDDELDAELRFHIDEERARLEAQGLAPDEARRRALARFGGLESIRERTRDARGIRWVEDLIRDLRYGARTLRARPAFAFTAVFTLAVGIGATVAVFGVVDALILRPLPIARPDETFVLNRTGHDELNLRFSYPTLRRFANQVPDAAFSAMTQPGDFQLAAGGRSEVVSGQLVDGQWFSLLGVSAAAGRLLAPGDNRALGAHPIVVISHPFWLRAFGRDPEVVGRTVSVNGQPMTVVGVAEAGFLGMYVGRPIDVWAPLMMQSALRYFSDASSEGFADTSQPWPPQPWVHWLRVVGRAGSAIDRGALAGRIDEVYRHHLEETGTYLTDSEEMAFRMRQHVELLPGARGLSDAREEFARPLGVLMTAVLVVLLVTCANLAGLILARNAAREREFALRLSLGATRLRLARQLITETLLVAVLGGTLAVGIAAVGSRLLVVMASSETSRLLLDVGVDWRLLSVTLATSLITGLLVGIGPVWRLSHAEHDSHTNRQTRSAAGTTGLARLPFGRLLVATQVALSLVLLTSSALFIQTRLGLLGQPTGFDQHAVVSVRFDTRLAGVPAAELPALHARLIEQVLPLPGVQSASLAYTGLVTGSAWISVVVVEGRPKIAGADDSAREEIVGLDYLHTVGIPLLAGRDFTPADRDGTARVAIVNEAFADHFFGDADPIGRRFGYSPDQLDREIVGVVADARVDGLRDGSPRQVLYPVAQRPTVRMANLYVRVVGRPDGLEAALGEAVANADSRLTVRQVAPLNQLAARTISRDRLLSELTGTFAVLALSVACLGLFGTVSYSVTRRTAEIGLRMALGASPAVVRHMVRREVLLVVVAGCTGGIGLALLSLRALDSLLFGVSATDPLTIGAVTAVLLATGLLAGWLPSMRAGRIDPIRALRTE